MRHQEMHGASIGFEMFRLLLDSSRCRCPVKCCRFSVQVMSRWDVTWRDARQGMEQFLQISFSLAFETCGPHKDWFHATTINEKLLPKLDGWLMRCVCACVHIYIYIMHNRVQRCLDCQATAQMASVTMPDSEIVLTLQMSEPLAPRCWLQPGDEAFQGVQMGPNGSKGSKGSRSWDSASELRVQVIRSILGFGSLKGYYTLVNQFFNDWYKVQMILCKPAV